MRFNLFNKKNKDAYSYDKEHQIPVLHCSICTGETVAGFKDVTTGKFEEIMLIKSEADIAEFKMKYGIETELVREY